jgi:predicted tellurium resistance membrane protein TerC
MSFFCAMLQEIVIPLLSLIALEVVLGIDNIIFISILADKLPNEQRDKLRMYGIGLAMLFRLVLLAAISWIIKLDQTLFSIAETEITGKGLILIVGGVFLIYKSTKEIYHKTETKEAVPGSAISPKNSTFGRMLFEIILLDLVFSIDSIITAVGLVDQLWIMYTAVIVSVLIMFFASRPISGFISRHPSFKILALSFLMVIGVSLLAEGFHVEIPKGYIYFAMAFSLLVDVLQMKAQKKQVS